MASIICSVPNAAPSSDSVALIQLAKLHQPIFSLADVPPKWMNRSPPPAAGGVSSIVQQVSPSPVTTSEREVELDDSEDDWDIETTSLSASPSRSASPSLIGSERDNPVPVDDSPESRDASQDGAEDEDEGVMVDRLGRSREERREESWYTALPSPIYTIDPTLSMQREGAEEEDAGVEEEGVIV